MKIIQKIEVKNLESLQKEHENILEQYEKLYKAEKQWIGAEWWKHQK